MSQIRGFHKDEEGDWVADLDCGHTRHMRHNPPWQERGWVTTRSGRESRIGQDINCKECEEQNMKKKGTGLQALPWIGPSIEKDLIALGFQTPDELRGLNPEKMYDDLCELRGQKIDRCVLYTFRCAVYASSTERADPELLKWWNWKDRTL